MRDCLEPGGRVWREGTELGYMYYKVVLRIRCLLEIILLVARYKVRQLISILILLSAHGGASTKKIDISI